MLSIMFARSRCLTTAFVLSATVCFWAEGLPAQETRGSIQGRILDSSAAAFPNATVTATNTATNVRVTAVSNAEGLYNLLFLLPGVYTVEATANGFKTARRENIELRIHDRLQVDFSLEVGSVTEKLEVTAEAPLLQTATANIGQVFDTKRLGDLPIPHGSPYSLLFYAPGMIVARSTNRLYQETSNLDQMSNEVSFNGQPVGTGDWTIDGQPNIQSSKSIGPMNSPPADIVQEVKVETAFDASVGHTSGTIVNISLKTGGNTPHGTAFGFFRNPDWDANNFFANRVGQPKPPYFYKRWGASLTGPVYLPGLYKGRDKTFFTYGYEGTHRTENNTTTSTVPTAQQLSGDMSGLLAVSSRYQIYDPSTIQPAGGGRFSIQPFPGNIIPGSRISPIARSIAAHWPEPNAAGSADGTNNFTRQNQAEPDLYYNHTARIDHNLSDKQRLYGRITGMRRIAGPYFFWYDDPSQGNKFVGRTKQAAIDDVYTLSPHTVINARYSYSRFQGVGGPQDVDFDPAQLGFAAPVASLMTERAKFFPNMQVSGLLSLGVGGPRVYGTDIHALFASVNHQFTRHNVSIGGDIRASRGLDNAYGSAAGQFVFGPTYTLGPLDNSAPSPGGLGQGLAAFLLGQPTSGGMARNDSQAIQSTYWSFYIHDHWRVNQKLTLELGLRWEYEGPLTERFNRSVRGFDATASQQIEGAAKANYAANPDISLPVDQFHVRGGLLYADVGGVPRELWQRTFKNFAPRIGFAYQTLPNLVLRGGFGVFPISIGQPTANAAIQSGYNFTTQLVPTLDNGQNFIANLANPFPNGLQAASGNSLGLATFLGNSISFYNPNAPTPYAMNWNFNVQTLLPGSFLFEAGYTGNKSLKLRINQNIDATPNQYLSTSATRDQATIDYLSANVRNPFQGLIPNTNLNTSTISRSQLLRPYPQFTGVTMLNNQGYSWFHSLQMRLERRLSSGLTVQTAYTYSKKMEAIAYFNAGDGVPYRTISSIDRPHTLAFTGLYALPFGRGKKFAGNIGRVPDLLIGGWELGAQWQYQSGPPIGFGDVIFQGDIKDIRLPGDQQRVERWINIDAGFDRNSANQLASNLRRFPLRFGGIRAGKYNSADLSILKSFTIAERHRFQFRTEIFNALNHPTSFDAPNTNPTSAAFGTVTGQSALPRQIQLGIKYIF